MADGVGPAAYAERAKVPDLTAHGDLKIVPMRVAKNFFVAKGDPDPRGMLVRGADGGIAGTVSDIWVDRAEWQIRYLEVALEGGAGQTALLPMAMALIHKPSAPRSGGRDHGGPVRGGSASVESRPGDFL